MRLLCVSLSLLLGAGGVGCVSGNDSAEQSDPTCSVTCPDGTAVASYTSEELVLNAAFYVVEGTCETLCESLSPCIWPNVPTVVAGPTGPQYSCAPLANYTSLQDQNAVDFSWTQAAPLAAPWTVDSTLDAAPTWTGAEDIDGDGDDDLLIGVGSLLELGFSDRTGGFALAVIDLGDPVEHAVVAHLDPDPYADIAARVTGPDGIQRLRIFLGMGDGSFSAGTDAAVLGSTGYGPDLRDLDGDGHLDAVVQGSDLFAIGVLWGRGDGSFDPVDPLPGGCAQWGCDGAFWVADLGGPTILHRDAQYVHQAGRTFADIGAPTLPSALDRGGIVHTLFADIDGYGDDAIVGGTSGGFTLPTLSLSSELSEYAWMPLWCFLATEVVPVAGDLDGDGVLEVVAGGSDCSLMVHVGFHDGLSFPQHIEGAAGRPVLGDFAAEGHDRVVGLLP